MLAAPVRPAEDSLIAGGFRRGCGPWIVGRHMAGAVAGIAAPVLSVSNVKGQEQVNFQVPFDAAGRSTAAMIVTRDGQASASVDVPVAAVQPGVYTSDGTQAIVVHNADYTLAT